VSENPRGVPTALCSLDPPRLPDWVYGIDELKTEY
jgi:hypothetical protein